MQHEYRHELLSNALIAREREVIEYQVNIDNFERALQICASDPELEAFRQQLRSLLASSCTEQKKARVMLTAVKQQLEALTCTAV